MSRNVNLLCLHIRDVNYLWQNTTHKTLISSHNVCGSLPSAALVACHCVWRSLPLVWRSHFSLAKPTCGLSIALLWHSHCSLSIPSVCRLSQFAPCDKPKVSCAKRSEKPVCKALRLSQLTFGKPKVYK